MTQLPLSDYIKEIIPIARKAGKHALHFRQTKKLTVETKQDETLVSQVDTMLNTSLCNELRKLFPHTRVVGEESKREIVKDLAVGEVFYVDPIDGTHSFIYEWEKGEWAVMIGLALDGVPVLGCVYLPIPGCVYYGMKGQGSFRIDDGDDKPVKLSVRKSDLKNVEIVGSSLKGIYVTHLQETLKFKDMIQMSSMGRKCIEIANGLADLYINTTSSYWDTLPNRVILEEAGGSMLNMKGKLTIYDGLNPFHDESHICGTKEAVQKALELIEKM